MTSISEDTESKKGNAITSLIERLVTYMGIASSGTVMLALFFIVIEVASRALFNKPIKGVVEISGFLLVIVVFLGIAYVQLRKGHVRIDLFILRLPPRLRSLHFMLTSIIIITIFSLFGYYGAKMTIKSFLTGEYEINIPFLPVWIIRIFVPIGALLVNLIVVSELFQEICKFIRLNSNIRNNNQKNE